MRGLDQQQIDAFSYRTPEQRVPQDHPLRTIRTLVNDALQRLSPHFDALYARGQGRPSIPPEQLLRALLLQVLYSIRSERQLMERIEFDIMYRWFVGLNLDDAVWTPTVFSKNRRRLLQGEVAQRLLALVVEQARELHLLSEEHFTVDGTLIQAWAHRRSFHPKDPDDVVGTGSHGEKLLRDTHESKTDPEARLYCKGGPNVPSYLGHILIENRNGLVLAACATQSSKKAEAEAAVQMLDTIGPSAKAATLGTGERTVGADCAYQQRGFIEQLRARHLAPHVVEYSKQARFQNFLTAAERADPRFAISQSKRKLIEKVFGWGKQERPLKQVKLRGKDRVDWMVRLVMTAYNLVRLTRLTGGEIARGGLLPRYAATAPVLA